MGEKQNVPNGTVDSLVAHYCVESLRPHAYQTGRLRIAEPPALIGKEELCAIKQKPWSQTEPRER